MTLRAARCSRRRRRVRVEAVARAGHGVGERDVRQLHGLRLGRRHGAVRLLERRARRAAGCPTMNSPCESCGISSDAEARHERSRHEQDARPTPRRCARGARATSAAPAGRRAGPRRSRPASGARRSRGASDMPSETFVVTPPLRRRARARSSVRPCPAAALGVAAPTYSGLPGREHRHERHRDDRARTAARS